MPYKHKFETEEKHRNISWSNRIYKRPMECSEWIDFWNGRLFFLVLFYFCIRWADETHLNFNGQSVNGSKICFNWDSAYMQLSLSSFYYFAVRILYTITSFSTKHRFCCIYYWFWKHMCCLLLLSSAIPWAHVGWIQCVVWWCLLLLLCILRLLTSGAHLFCFCLRMWKFRCGSQKPISTCSCQLLCNASRPSPFSICMSIIRANL